MKSAHGRFLCVLTVLLLTGRCALGAGHPKEWIGPSMGKWLAPENWDPAATPDATDCVYVRNNLAVQMDKSGTNNEALELHLSDGPGRAGIVYQYAGTFAADLVVVGDGEGGNGQYLMHSGESTGSPPASFASGVLQLGNAGVGAFTQSTGTVAAAELVMGRLGSGSGTYFLYGGRLLGDSAILGAAGDGVMENHGTHYVDAGGLTMGLERDSAGTYRLVDGASLEVKGDTVVGAEGVGTFYHTHGDTVVQGTLWVGKEGRGEGTYYLRAGELNTDVTSIGSSGQGTMETSNAKHVTATDLTLGGGGRGVYRLQAGGELEVRRDLTVAIAGDGVFEHEGGDSTVARALRIGSTVFGGAGTYTMASGRLLAGTIHVEKGVLDWIGGTIIGGSVAFEPDTTLRMGFNFRAEDLQSGRLFDAAGPVTGLGHTTVEVTRGADATHYAGGAMIGTLVLGTADGEGSYELNGTGDLWAGELTVGKAGGGQMVVGSSREAVLFCGEINVGTHGQMNILRDWVYGSTGNWDIRGRVLASGHSLGLDNGSSILLQNDPNTLLAAGQLVLADGSGSDVSQYGGWAGFNELTVGKDCLYYKTFGELEVAHLENHEMFRQSNGTTAVSGDVANYHKLVTEGGSITIGRFENLFEWREGGGPTMFPHAGSYVRGSAQLHSDSMRNETYAFVGGNARMTAGAMVNEAPVDPIGAPPTGPDPVWGFEGRGVYLYDRGILEANQLDNHGLIVLADDAVLQEKSRFNTEPLTNYPGAQVRMGGDFTEMSSAVGSGGCRFDHHLVNYGLFAYYGGTFAGTYEHRTDARGFHQNADFTAEGGIVNYGTLANTPWMDLTADGTGLSNYGLLDLSYAALGGAGMHNEPGGEIHASGFATIETTVNNAGLLHTTDILTVTSQLTNLGGGLIEVAQGQRLDVSALRNLGVIEFLRGGVIEGGPVDNEDSGLIRMEGGGTLDATVNNEGVIEINAGGLSGGSALTCSIRNLGSNEGFIRVGNGARLDFRGEAPIGGLIELEGPDTIISGDVLILEGELRGAGTVAMSVQNAGAIRAEYTAGTSPATEHALVLTSDRNTNSGRIEVAEGNAVRYTQGLSRNHGTIALQGGTFDNVAAALQNPGTISGWGRVSCGSLEQAGRMSVGGGDMDVMGPVANDGLTEVAVGSTLTFFDEVTGDGVAGGGTVRFLGGFRPGHSPGIAGFGGHVQFGAGGVLGMELADPNNVDPADPHYDALFVEGDVALGGVLELDWLGREGDPNSMFGGVYDLITYGGRLEGGFAAISGTIGQAYIRDLTLDAEGEGGLHVVRLTLHAQLPGDCDLDGDVDGEDLEAIEAHLNQSDAEWFEGEVSFDGAVDHIDYLLWKANAGASVPGGAIPEPATVLLLAMGGFLAMRRRRWRPDYSRYRERRDC